MGSVEPWILSISKTPRLIKGNRPLTFVLNKQNEGFGLVLVHDPFICSNVIFKGSTFPQKKWELICDKLVANEPDSWHIVKTGNGNEYATFLTNGTKAHQYPPLSNITHDLIVEMVEAL